MSEAEKWELFRAVADEWGKARIELTLCSTALDHAFMQLGRAEMLLQRAMDLITGKHDLPKVGSPSPEEMSQIAQGITS